MNKYNVLRKELKKYSKKNNAQNLQRFFKTGKGEYGEGDEFLGIMVPNIRKVGKKFVNLSSQEIQKSLKSKYHEERLAGLLILVEQFEKGDKKIKNAIYNFYLKNLKSVNNWDLVDLTAPRIIGGYLFTHNRKVLYRLADSKNLWNRRVAVLSTFYFIRQKDFKDALQIARILIQDKHDLIHKAVGWMLREIGNRSIKTEIKFLNQYFKQMPRTMLRYAIEKFPETLRIKYLE